MVFQGFQNAGVVQQADASTRRYFSSSWLPYRAMKRIFLVVVDGVVSGGSLFQPVHKRFQLDDHRWCLVK
jgi:hypothetical protein